MSMLHRRIAESSTYIIVAVSLSLANLIGRHSLAVLTIIIGQRSPVLSEVHPVILREAYKLILVYISRDVICICLRTAFF